MSYLVLARKYRPQTFADVVGQEHVARTLANAIDSERVAHAFLFTGIRGVGKTTAARLLAKALNCERGISSEPCNACSNCVEIGASSSVDVAEIDGASNRGIDAIRELNENVRYLPAKSRFRIYIIDEAHMVTREGFNALLKTLEEPPEHVKFIFATTAFEKFPDTIVSRCQRYDFKRISLSRIAEHLRFIVGEEKVEATDGSLLAIAREAEGSMRDAESILDRVIAFAKDAIDESTVSEVVGVADRSAVFEATEAVLSRDPARALEIVDSVHDAGKDVERFSRDLVGHWRNLVVSKVDPSGVGLAEVPEEERARLSAQAERWPVGELQRGFRIVHRGDTETAGSPYPRLVLEMTLVRLATLEPVLPVDEALAKLEALGSSSGDRRPREGAPRTSPPAESRSPKPGRTGNGSPGRAEAPPPSAPATPESAATRWPELLEFLKERKVSLYLGLSDATPKAYDGSELTISVSRANYREELNRRDTLAVLRQVVTEFYGRETRVSIDSEPKVPTAPAPSREEEPGLANRALGDPQVQKAVEILGGEVTEVRPVRRRRNG